MNSEREDSGMEVVRWLESLSKEERKAFEDTVFVCHDHNLRAGRNMTKRIQSLGLHAKQIPFGEGEILYD